MAPSIDGDRGLTGDAYRGAGWIRTQNGRFHLEEPEFIFDDIAHSLAQIGRYNGHTLYPISVAEHSVNVARIMFVEGGEPREGLMHDGTEAYLSDVPAPFKQYMPDWQDIDSKLELKLREHYELGDKTDECKRADWIALFIEAYWLIPGKGEDFSDPLDLRDYALDLMEVQPILQPQNKGWQHDKLLFTSIGKVYGLC
jgi:hypothetical protein